MKRRDFLHRTSALATVPFIGMAMNSDTVYGHGEKRYRLDTDWVKSDGMALPVNDCHEMVQDHRKRIVLLTNETKNNVIFFNKSGKTLNSWGTQFPGAHGLSLIGEGNDQVLFITDTVKNQFYKTTLYGKVLNTWDFPKESGKYEEAKQFVPTETAITRNGEVYVADGYGSQYIIHYNTAGQIKNIFGGRGDQPENLDNAHGICIDYRTSPETLMVTDRTRCCFKRFTLAGKYIETIELPGACVCRPVIKGDYLYAAVLRSPSLGNDNSGFVIILNKENKPVSALGGSEPAYDEDNKLKTFQQSDPILKHPHDVLVDDDDNLYVCQWNSGKVYPYRFTPVA